MFIHEKAICESSNVGDGTRIWPFAHVMKDAIVGKNCNIGEHSFIESGAFIGNQVTIKNGVSIWDKVTICDGVFIGPNVVFTNDLFPRTNNKKKPEEFIPTIVESGATIGANLTIICGIKIGKFSFIGAGSVVTKDVRDFELVVGNPAVFHSWICECGNKLFKKIQQNYECECSNIYKFVDERLIKSN